MEYTRYNEEERKRTIGRLIEIVKQDVPQSVCDSLGDCGYIRENIDATSISATEAYGYITLICEKYPGACELNQDS